MSKILVVDSVGSLLLAVKIAPSGMLLHDR